MSEVQQIIKSLKNNKAADEFGLVAENLKYGGNSVASFIASVLNSIFKLGKVPETLKLGFITPIYKKKKTWKANS